MGRKNLSKRNSKRRGNKYRNSKRMNSKRMNSKRRYYKRRTNNYRNTKKRTNKFKNSNRKLKKFIGGGAKKIVINRDLFDTENFSEYQHENGSYFRVTDSYKLVFKYLPPDRDIELRIDELPEKIIKGNKELITSVRHSIVSYFDSFKDNNEEVISLQAEHHDITYKYYFRMEGGNKKVELKANNTIDEDIVVSNIDALIIELNYEDTATGRPCC